VNTVRLVLIVAGAALGGGAMGGLAVAKLGGDRPKGAASAKAGEDALEPEQAGSLAERVERLERELATVKRQRNAAEALAAYGSALADDEAQGDGGSTAGRHVIDEPVFELAVRDVVDRVDAERSADRRARRMERQNAAAKRMIERYAEELKLTADQKTKMEAIVREHLQAMTALRDSDGDAGAAPASRDEWRERMRGMREQTEKKLSGVLDQTQMEKYRELRSEEGFGMGGGRRGRRGRDDGE
jgi:hypothetical protein